MLRNFFTFVPSECGIPHRYLPRKNIGMVYEPNYWSSKFIYHIPHPSLITDYWLYIRKNFHSVALRSHYRENFLKKLKLWSTKRCNAKTFFVSFFDRGGAAAHGFFMRTCQKRQKLKILRLKKPKIMLYTYTYFLKFKSMWHV